MNFRVLILACLFSAGLRAQESVVLNTITDSPDPLSAPVHGAGKISGNFSFSGNGPDIDNASVTARSLLRMSVEVRGPAPSTALVATLQAESSASRNPGDP